MRRREGEGSEGQGRELCVNLSDLIQVAARRTFFLSKAAPAGVSSYRGSDGYAN